ncbi:MAG: DUF6788 family protein [bacterium]
MSIPEDVPKMVAELAKDLAAPSAMRRGSVGERWMKCGQSGCACRRDEQARHGPYLSLTRMEGGRTRSRYLSSAEAGLARAQVDAGQRFRRRVESYWQACERWADAQLESAQAGSQEAAKKGAMRKPSRPRPPARSKRS